MKLGLTRGAFWLWNRKRHRVLLAQFHIRFNGYYNRRGHAFLASHAITRANQGPLKQLPKINAYPLMIIQHLLYLGMLLDV